VRIHHCIADGIALISVTMSLVDGGAPPPSAAQEAPAGAEDWIADALIKPLTDITVRPWALATARPSRWDVRDPQKGHVGLAGHGAAGLPGGERRGALALMPDDSPPA
jgi:hypothetical protein